MNWECVREGHAWDCRMDRRCKGNHTCLRCGKRGPKPISHLKLMYALLLRRNHSGRLWVRGHDGRWHDADDWATVRPDA